MNSNYLKYLMAEAQLQQSKIAKDLGIKRTGVCRVVNGKERSRTIEEHIKAKLVAAELVKEDEELFPLTDSLAEAA